MSCWNINRMPNESEIEHIRRMERLASHLNDICILFRNMQKQELSISRIGELKGKQWEARKP